MIAEGLASQRATARGTVSESSSDRPIPLSASRQEVRVSKSSYEAWFRKVDQAIQRLAGVSALDLSDQPYWDWWEEGMTPTAAARSALTENGW